MSCPDEFSVGVHCDGGFVASHFDENRSLVIPDGDRVASFQRLDAPNTLHVVVKRVFESVRVGMPDAKRTVFRTGQNDGQFGMIGNGRHVLRMS